MRVHLVVVHFITTRWYETCYNVALTERQAAELRVEEMKMLRFLLGVTRLVEKIKKCV